MDGSKMLMTFTSFVLLALVPSAPAQTQERVIGLLALPEVFGDHPCDRFSPTEVPLYASPDAAEVVGRIRVRRNWTFAEAGGCEGLDVGVEIAGAEVHEALPRLEHDYEEPGAIVLEQRGGWFKVRLAQGAAWVRASSEDTFYPLESLLPDNLTYLTDHWDRMLSASPGEPGRPARAPQDDPASVRVTASRRLGGDVWFHVELMDRSPCVDPDASVIDQGWVPAHVKSGELSLWFYSRGC